MAILQLPGDIKNVKFVDLPVINKTAGLWVVKLRSAADVLVVPGLDSTSAVSSLTASVTATNYYLYDGTESPLEITGGSNGTEVVIATLHRKGLINNLSKDSTPT